MLRFSLPICMIGTLMALTANSELGLWMARPALLIYLITQWPRQGLLAKGLQAVEQPERVHASQGRSGPSHQAFQIRRCPRVGPFQNQPGRCFTLPGIRLIKLPDQLPCVHPVELARQRLSLPVAGDHPVNPAPIIPVTIVEPVL